MSGDIFVTTGGAATGIQGLEARNAVEHPLIQGAASP